MSSPPASYALFLHSTGTGPSLWDAVPDAVLRGGVKLAPANIGYPPGPPLPRGERTGVLDDAARARAALPDDGRPVDLYAHSYGAFVAIEVARALGPRVRSLFVMEPVLFGALAQDPPPGVDPQAMAEVGRFDTERWFVEDEERGGTEPWLEVFIDYWNRPGSWARMPAPLQAYSRAVGWKMFQEVRSCFYENRAFAPYALDAYPAVTLAVGERSPAASREMTRAIAARSPRARVITLPKVGHMAPVTHPAVLWEAMAAHAAAL